MKIRKITLVICSLACLLIIVFVSNASADSYFKQQTYTGAIETMGQPTPERYDTTETWVGEKNSYSSLPGNYAFLIKVDEGIGISINHNDSSYAEVSMDFDVLLSKVVDDTKKAEKTKDAIGNMMGTMEATVTSTDETKKIKDWNAKKYILNVIFGKMTMKSEIWATEDIKIDYNLYYLTTNAMMSSLPGFEDLVSEFNKIKGISVLTNGELDMMGNKSISSNTLLEYKEIDPPTGIYEIPKGYKKITVPGMGH